MPRWIILSIILNILSTGALHAGIPWTYSLGVSGLDYIWLDEDTGNHIQEQMVGLDIRGSAILKPMGFYYGTFLSFAWPLLNREYDLVNETSTENSSGYDLYMSFGIPFGYRWQLPRSYTAIYLGLGPSMQGLFDFDSHFWGSGGLFWEFGVETLSSEGVEISMGARMIMGWGSFATDGSRVVERPLATTSIFFIGLSWTGTRGY